VRDATGVLGWRMERVELIWPAGPEPGVMLAWSPQAGAAGLHSTRTLPPMRQAGATEY
jgi:hypothetical protein